MDRRGFLIRFGGLIATVPPLSALLAGCVAPVRDVPAPPTGFPAQTWRTLVAVQEHLLPPEPGAPGASEIQAEAFLRGVLADPGLAPADRALFIGGAELLAQRVRDLTGETFADLPDERRETVLRQFEATPEGERWIGGLLDHLMEALLGDPVYGGNPGGIGWNWLAHTPGFPRPPADKRYFLL